MSEWDGTVMGPGLKEVTQTYLSGSIGFPGGLGVQKVPPTFWQLK